MQLTSRDFRGLINQRFLKNFFPVPASCRFDLGETVPDFTLQESSGRVHQLSHHREKPVVIVFTRILAKQQYCPSRYSHIVAMEKAYRQFVGLGAVVLMVTSIDAEQSKIVKRDLSLEMPLLTNSSCTVFRQYGTGHALGTPLPAQFVLDSKGQLRFQHLFSFAHHNATPERLLWAIRNL